METDDLSENGRRQMMGPEQKCILLKKDIAHNVSNSGPLVLNDLRRSFLQGKRAYYWTSVGGSLDATGCWLSGEVYAKPCRGSWFSASRLNV